MGTKMTLHRYSPVTKDWEETLLFVDQNFLDTYGKVNPTIPTGHTYEINKGLLKVYLNGRRLNEDISYNEVDDQHIQLLLGADESGNPLNLKIGDQIFIEVYKNQYCSRGQATVSGTEFYELKKEITDARRFKDGDEPSRTLDERLDEIQRQLEVVYGGTAEVDIAYEHNSRDQITREIITGDYSLVREFTYYEDEDPHIKGEMKTETIYYTDSSGSLLNKVTKGYSYDPATRRLLRTSIRVDT
ncbi:hypothetical protein RS399_03835 [Bacillus inaquosorum]|uniref:hypothetical protein n=1 Tax=Bacillus inaquosorum TaxID=483913 RepID=UPI0028FC1CCA|nr:hypothetical protein [Bacillus inaquosorum]WNW25052.1 hypothetical protein RS399_03835 [Bacillus inaquosorum]